MAGKAVATRFSLENVAKLGILPNGYVEGNRCADGAVVVTDYLSLKTTPALSSLSGWVIMCTLASIREWWRWILMKQGQSNVWLAVLSMSCSVTGSQS